MIEFISFHHRDLGGKAKHLYRCFCGKEFIADAYNVKSNHTKSCGCLKQKHGFRKEKDTKQFYIKWESMNNRCNCVSSGNYKYYGAKGVKVCYRWRDFINFKEDMYNSYLEHVALYGEKQTTLDRIDPFGNYEPFNCRWLTNLEQQHNKRCNFNK